MRHAYCFVAVIISLCVLVLSGCARLSVRVAILNTSFWASPQYLDSVTLAKIIDMEEAILDGRFINKREVFRATVRQKTEEASKEKGARIDPDPPIFQGILDALNKKIDDSFETASVHFKAAFDEAIKQAKATPIARTSYAQGTGELVKLQSEITKIIRKGMEMEGGWTSPALQKLEQEGKVVIEGLIGGAEILEDPRASAVVHAPPVYWEAPPYFNQTLCNGFFGNTDCAVKMDGLGNFTLKGVRLDATKITQATFSVAMEAIQVVAVVYGIPVPKSQPAQGGQGSDNQALGEITSPVKRQRDAETAILQFRLARIAMFEAIVARRDAISDTTEQSTARKNAIEAIKAVLKANKEQLVPSPAQ